VEKQDPKVHIRTSDAAVILRDGVLTLQPDDGDFDAWIDPKTGSLYLDVETTDCRVHRFKVSIERLPD
jgi:hypothetical protein